MFTYILYNVRIPIKKKKSYIEFGLLIKYLILCIPDSHKCELFDKNRLV